MDITTPDIVRSLVAQLPPEKQEQVLEFTRNLSQTALPPGAPIENLLRFAGRLPPEVADEMAEALKDLELIEEYDDDLSF